MSERRAPPRACRHACYRACVAQLTLRVEDDLADGLRAFAEREGKSVNAVASNALRALIDPDAAGSETDRYRERLRRMGLLAEPALKAGPRPDPHELAEAARQAAKGKMLSDIILEDRD